MVCRAGPYRKKLWRRADQEIAQGRHKSTGTISNIKARRFWDLAEFSRRRVFCFSLHYCRGMVFLGAAACRRRPPARKQDRSHLAAHQCRSKASGKSRDEVLTGMSANNLPEGGLVCRTAKGRFPFIFLQPVRIRPRFHRNAGRCS